MPVFKRDLDDDMYDALENNEPGLRCVVKFQRSHGSGKSAFARAGVRRAVADDHHER